MGREYHVIAFLSTAEQTLNKAKAVISLARNYAEHCKTLSACATILLASALEQGISSVISFRAECAAMDEDIDVQKTAYAALSKESFRERMQSLPRMLTDGNFDLNYQSPLINYLERLIARRNKLVHINENATHLVTPNKQVIVEEKRLIAIYPIPENIWDSVNLGEVENYQKAVECYFREVLFPNSDEFKTGEIIVPST